MKTTEMLETYPATINLDRQLLARVIETLVACSQACTACADACLSEEMVADLRTPPERTASLTCMTRS